MAMLLAALAAVVAATLLADQERWLRNVVHRRDQVQAQAIAMAGVQWARQILEEDARTTTIDHLGEPWALQLPPIPVGDGEVRGAIRDAQGRLNINALAERGNAGTVQRARLQRLFAAQGGPTAALDAIADWVDDDAQPRAAGAEDGWYRMQSRPTLPSNAPVVRLLEITAVRGVDPARLAAIAPFATALPVQTPVNVNTAAPEVLATLFDAIGAADITAIVASRRERPFGSIAEFRTRLPPSARLGSEEALDVRSRHFEISVEARQGTSVARARALVRRDAKGVAAVVWQVVE